jgi:hemerythrin
MPFLEWRDEFSIGIAEVDHEHRELIRLINEVFSKLLQAPGDPRIGAFLGELHSKIAAHFALEESVMRERRYDGYAAHKLEHESLLNEVREIMDAYDAGGYVGAENDLTQTLETWFGRHFRTQDATFHRAIAGRAPPPVG